ncbi:MAG: hypothetical protein ACI9MC_000115 [Kiritimatiellia bacterium]|jgi:hypothetical protein
MLRTLVRGLLRRRAGLSGGRQVPRIEASARGVVIDEGNLASFIAIARSPASRYLPLVYPQLVAGPLHVKVLSDKRMPVGAMGIVHVRNHIEQVHAIDSGACLDLHVMAEGHRVVKHGAEIDLLTEVTVDGEVAWRAVTTILARGPWGSGEGSTKASDPLPSEGEIVWNVPENIGRKYRKVSGDVNPIHLHALPAKLLGFERAIAHGTWTLSRCAAELGESDESVCLDVHFRRPVFLPGVVRFRSSDTSNGVDFELLNRNGDKQHLFGHLSSAQDR